MPSITFSMQMNLTTEKSDVETHNIASMIKVMLHFYWVNICQWFMWLCMANHGKFHVEPHTILVIPSISILNAYTLMCVYKKVVVCSSYYMFEVIALKPIKQSSCNKTPWGYSQNFLVSAIFTHLVAAAAVAVATINPNKKNSLFHTHFSHVQYTDSILGNQDQFVVLIYFNAMWVWYS